MVEYNTSPSFFIYKKIDIDVLLYKFMSYLNLFESKYGFNGAISLDIFVKDWIADTDLKTFNLILNKLVEEDEKSKEIHKNAKLKALDKSTNFDEGLSFFRSDIGTVDKKTLAVLIEGLEYGSVVSEKEIDDFDYTHPPLVAGLNLNKETDTLYIYKTNITGGGVLPSGNRRKRFLVKVTSCLPQGRSLEDMEISGVNKVSVYIDTILTDKTQKLAEYSEIESWTDTIRQSGCNEIVERISQNNGLNITFENNKIIKLDKIFKSKKLLEAYQDFDQDENIGVLDIETFKNDNKEAVPYAIGFKLKSGSKLFYLDSYNNPSEMILDCLENMLVKENHNFKFYAHNMSQFDGILLLKSLMHLSNNHDLNFNVHSNNEGKIISLDIVKKIKGQKKIIKISILDSFLLLPFKLKKLGIVFNCEVSKGIYPYKFINQGNINYIGCIPGIEYFSGKEEISTEEYKDYINEIQGNWDCKLETLKYLEKDLDILYDIMHKFNNTTFREFKVNISRIRTISGLAFLIFSANYYKPKSKPIYFTKGRIEEFIRQGYYGGIVDVFTNYTDYETYKYDVNSHYPNAMLMPMPGGKPRISTEKNLDKIFGFVEAKVKGPSKEQLRVPILPVKINGKTVLFRNTVVGVWWSEELKMARDLGYKILEIKSCVLFDKVEGFFEDYVNTIYAKKLKSEKEENEIQRLIYKLLLNSLYGRLGIKGTINDLKIIRDNPQGKKITKVLETENSDILYQANDLFLVKSEGPLDPEILNLISKEKLYKDENNGFHCKNPWKGISSSVQFSAAITAYARMHLNKFKNIPGNEYLGGDTDSIILTYPLDEKYIGSSLGLFKLEHVIVEGFYLQKKFYMLITKNNKIIIKAKGISENKLLNYNSILELFKGNPVIFPTIVFMKDYKTLEVKIINTEKEIKGLQNTEINYKIKHRSIGYRKDLNIIPYIESYLSIAKQLLVFNGYVTTPALQPAPATTHLSAHRVASEIAPVPLNHLATTPRVGTAPDPPYSLYLLVLLALFVFLF
jgi:hypothetical protein